MLSEFLLCTYHVDVTMYGVQFMYRFIYTTYTHEKVCVNQY